jgi:lysophospholipase L1-like esterase
MPRDRRGAIDPNPAPTARSSVVAKLLVAIGGLLVSLLLLEGLLRVYLLLHTVYDVEMTRYALLAKQASPNPHIGHVHKPNVDATLMNVPVHINADGLRDVDHPIPHGDRYRIAILGDSFTFGWGVKQSDTFAARLEAWLNERYPTEVINFGTGNYNSEQEVNLFLEKGLKYHPDKVVVFYFINDAEPTVRHHSGGFLYHSRLVTFVWSKIHALLSDYGDEIHNYKGYYADLYRPDSAGWKNTRDALLQLRDLCRERGIALQVVLIPDLHELHEYPFADEHRLIASFLRDNGVPVLDLAPLFKDYPEPTQLWVSADDAHANALGHELIAKYALDFIAEKNPTPPMNTDDHR